MPRLRRICSYCRRLIPREKLRARPSQAFCSHECWIDFTKERKERAEALEARYRICCYCDFRFVSKNRYKVYCKQECAWAARIERTQVVLICDGCRKPFPCRPSEISPGRNFHNKECFLANSKKTKRKSLAYICSTEFVKVLVECQETNLETCAVPWCKDETKGKGYGGNNWPVCYRHHWFISSHFYHCEKDRVRILMREGLTSVNDHDTEVEIRREEHVRRTDNESRVG